MNDASLFSKNVAAWEIINPQWAGLVQAVECSFIFFSENPDGRRNLFVEINGEKRFFYPQEQILELEKEWTKKINLELSLVIFIYGLGLGYHYQVLKEWLHKNPRRRVVVFEDNLEVVHRFLETELADEFLHDKQARLEIITWPWRQDDPAIRSHGLAYCYDSYDIVPLEFYSQVRADRFFHLKELLNFWLMTYDKSCKEIFGSQRNFIPKYIENIFSLPTAYWGSFWKGKFSGIPAIICGAGPSLNKNSDVLKTLKNHALIFGPGTSMNALNSLGLIPHFGVGIDPNFVQFDRIFANESFETPYFYRNRINPEALKLIQGDKIAIPGAGFYTFPTWFEKELGLETMELDEGNNVINFSLSIAEMLGCSPIILVGVDLAYTDNQSYAANLADNAFITKSHDEELIVDKDIYGKSVYTLWKWKNESNWIGSFLKQHPHTKLINATEGGLGFPGVPNMKLSEVASKYLDKTYDFQSKIHGETQNSKMPAQVTKKRIKEILQYLKDSLLRCLKLYQEKDPESKLQNELAYKELLVLVQKMFNNVLGVKARLSQSLEDFKEKKEQVQEELKTESLRYMERYTKNILAAFNFLDVDDVDALPVQGKVHESPETNFEGNFGTEQNTFYPEGSLKELYFQRNEKLNGPSFFFSEKGQLLSVSFYEDGLKEGAAHTYYASGNLKAKMSFLKGSPEGVQEYYYDSGIKRSHLPYKEGLLHGIVLLYYPDGRKKREIQFESGRRDGLERFWDMNGQLLIEILHGKGRRMNMSTWYPNGQLRMRAAYDPAGKEVELEEWDTIGGKKSPKELDYLDLLIASTKSLAEAIDLCSLRVEDVLKNLHKTHSNLIEEFQELKVDLVRLKEANEKIQITFSEETFKEPIWKSTVFQKQVHHQIGGMIEQMIKEVQKIYHVIEEAHKKLGT